MTVPFDKWQRAQALEAEYHNNDEWRKSPAFMEDTGKLFEFFGFTNFDYMEGDYEDWSPRYILDAGAGSITRLDWFYRCTVEAIEPMGELHDVPTYDFPLERFIPALRAKYDAVFCINVLDHTYDPQKVVENCIAYLAKGGTLCLSTDFGEPNEMHPAVFTEADVESWLQGVTVERKLRGIPGHKGYRNGCEAVTWICRK